MLPDRESIKTRLLALIVSLTYLTSTSAFAGDDKLYLPPRELPQKGGATFYSPRDNSTLLIGVHVWGEVASPGYHLVPKDSPFSYLLSTAGGPKEYAILDEINLRRNGKESQFDYVKASEITLKNNDIIYVDRSIKADLPIYFGAITTTLALLTFIIVINRD